METVMADPVGVFARGDTFVCGVCAHLHLGCRKHKTTLLCMPTWLPELGALCVLVCVSWYTLEGMETFANRAAAVLLFLACSGQ